MDGESFHAAWTGASSSKIVWSDTSGSKTPAAELSAMARIIAGSTFIGPLRLTSEQRL